MQGNNFGRRSGTDDNKNELAVHLPTTPNLDNKMSIHSDWGANFPAFPHGQSVIGSANRA